jgi:hypothetical protein
MCRLVALTVLGLGLATAYAQDAKDTEKAAATRKALMSKISVDYKDTLLQDVQFKVDPTGAASNNTKINYKAEEKVTKEVLDELCKKHDLTHSIISGKYKAFGVKYDGFVFIGK